MKAGHRVVAHRYARALLDVVLDEHVDPMTVEKELAASEALLDREPKLAEVLSAPRLAADKRAGVLEAVLASRELGPYTRNVLRLLTAKERMGLLPLVREQFRRLRLEHERIQPGEVVSAHPLSEDQRRRLAESLGGALRKTMELSYQTDRDLVGGLVVRLGNRVYDASVVTQLRRFKEKALSSF